MLRKRQTSCLSRNIRMRSAVCTHIYIYLYTHVCVCVYAHFASLQNLRINTQQRGWIRSPYIDICNDKICFIKTGSCGDALSSVTFPTLPVLPSFQLPISIQFISDSLSSAPLAAAVSTNPICWEVRRGACKGNLFVRDTVNQWWKALNPISKHKMSTVHVHDVRISNNFQGAQYTSST